MRRPWGVNRYDEAMNRGDIYLVSLDPPKDANTAGIAPFWLSRRLSSTRPRNFL